jgi:hypothetical protein
LIEDHLRNFIGGYRQSRSREYLLTIRLVHDLGVAAAACGYELLVYLPTVDSDGFDVIFDDRKRLVAMQLKSRVARGGTAGWKIRRSLLRPRAEEADLFGPEFSGGAAGRGGGVILTTATAVGETVDVTYSYTDMVVLSALWSNIVERRGAERLRLSRLRCELASTDSGSVEIPRSAFLKAGSPIQLLALAGLQSNINSEWRTHRLELLRHEHQKARLSAPVKVLRQKISVALDGLGANDPAIPAARKVVEL